MEVRFGSRGDRGSRKTFIVSHHGIIYERDLGMDTTAMANAITSFNPDASWQKVE